MAYTPTNWTNFPSTATPVNASNLNKIENELVALDTDKVDKEQGKGLSTNDYDNTAKGIVDGVTTALEDKVDKVSGKGLSTNDFDNTYKDKLDGISAQANKVEITPVVTEGTTLATISIDGVDTAIKGSDIDVDSAMSHTSENPVQNKVIYETLQNLLPEETAEGNPISITDASGLSAKSCSVTMNPIQDLHGQSAPYPAGGGKNKLPFDLATIKANNTAGTWNGNNYTYNGVTWTVNDDGTFIANNTATGGVSVFLIIGNNSQSSSAVNLSFPTTDYKITTGFTIDGTNTTYEIGYRPTGSSGATKHIYNNDGYALLSTGINLIQLVIREGYTANNLKFEPMIVPSTESDYTFIPYSNICPISGRDSVKLTRTGKNLFGGTPKYPSKVINSDGSLGDSNSYDTYEFLGGVNYILNLTKGTNFDTLRYARLSNGVWTRLTKSTFPLTIDTTTYERLRISVGKTDFASDIQLEIGSTATAYESYQGQTHTATFSDTVYGGVWKATEGKVVIDTLIVTYDKNSDWTRNTSGIFYVNAPRGIVDLVACNSFEPYIPYGSSTSIPDLNCRLNNAKTFINFKMLSCDTLEEFKQAIDGLTIQVAYKIATPQEITLTPETIELLKGNNVLFTDGDSVKLVYSADIKSYIAEQLSSLS